MQIFRISDLEDEKLDFYFDKLSSFDESKPVEVYIDSVWWDTTLSDFIIKMLKKFEIHISVYTAFSQWLVILDKLRDHAKSIYVYESAQGMAHFSCFPVYEVNWLGRCLYDKYKIEINKKQQYIPSVLTREQVEGFNKWDEIYILPWQLVDYYTK